VGLGRSFVAANLRLSAFLDGFLPARLREDGNDYFLREYVPRALQPQATVYDIGGGSRPCVSAEDKTRLGLRVVGLDLSSDELAAAPAGVYDRTIAADLCTYVGDQRADTVICQATLEHVTNTPGAVRGLASAVRPGGRVFIFAPSRNALFARLNLLLPDALKRRILFALFPHKAEGHDGFKAYYDNCTPAAIERLAETSGLEVVERRLFWTSSYFKVFTPAFILWRLWQGVAFVFLRGNAAETFAYVLRKPL
jgi:2-polyprenyl-6-hydroxyphenyl methylase/3-demethylubiquinone-9 3-methyltransferase